MSPGIERARAISFDAELRADALGVKPHGPAHVGDGAADIDGALRVGAVAILVERDGPRPELRERAHHVVSNHDELAKLLVVHDDVPAGTPRCD